MSRNEKYKLNYCLFINKLGRLISLIPLEQYNHSLFVLETVHSGHHLCEPRGWNNPRSSEPKYQVRIKVFPHYATYNQVLYQMRRNDLNVSLLSSSHYVIADKFGFRLQAEQDSNLDRLYRKFNQSTPELRKQQKQKRYKPFLCPMVFSPQSKFIIGWQVLNIIFIYIYFIQIPIIIAFEEHRALSHNQQFFKILNIPAIFIFICGIFISMNTSFYQDGLLKKDPLQIRSKYFKNNLIFDIISILAIAVYEILEINKMFEARGIKIFVSLFYLKMFDLIKIQQTMITSFDLNRRIKALLKFFLLLLKILLICNTVACFGFFISDYLSDHKDILVNCPDDQCYWVTNISYAKVTLKDQQDFIVQYLYSLYWASTTMISIGYGDITPKNPYEITFTIFIQFLSCLLFAYYINSIWSIIQQLNAKTSKIHSRLYIMNLYMRDKDIGPELTSRINAYLNNYYYAKNLREREMEAEIIAELTPALRKQLFYQSYSVIFSHKYFKFMSSEIMEEASCFVKQVGYYEDQMVFNNEQSKFPCLYFVKRGEMLNFTCCKTKFNIKNVYKGDLFGAYQFFTQLSFKSQLKGVKYTLAYYLTYLDWRRILLHDSTYFQRFYETKDQLLLYKNGAVIDYRCHFCSSKSHRTENCFDQEIRRLIKDPYNYDKNQVNQRRKYVRRQISLHNCSKLKRKISLKGVQRKGRMNKQLFWTQTLNSSLVLNKSHHDYNNYPYKRKSSFDDLLLSTQLRQGGKIFIKNQKNRLQNIKVLEKIRKEHGKLFNIEDIEQQSQKTQEIIYGQLDMDTLANYQEYYPIFNPLQFNTREYRQQAKRRLTGRSFR